jgi:predicted aspartyl protease
MLVELKMNDITMEALVDTGADATVISKEAAEQAGVK